MDSSYSSFTSFGSTNGLRALRPSNAASADGRQRKSGELPETQPELTIYPFFSSSQYW